jgi:DNA-binding transcriptional ArsR family regulator
MTDTLVETPIDSAAAGDNTAKHTFAKLKFCRIPRDILYLANLSPAEKIILGFAYSLQNGFVCTNTHLGAILNLHPGNVSLIISKLRDAGLITTEGQGRSRRINLSAGAKVGCDFTLAQAQPTLAQAQQNLSAGAKQYIYKDNIKKPTGLRAGETAAAGQPQKNTLRQQAIAEEQRLAKTVDQSKTVAERCGKTTFSKPPPEP